MTADMSTSLNVLSIAAVLCASTSRRAIVERRFDMGCVLRCGRRPRWPPRDARPVPPGAAAAGAGAGVVRAACSTSFFIAPTGAAAFSVGEIDLVALGGVACSGWPSCGRRQQRVRWPAQQPRAVPVRPRPRRRLRLIRRSRRALRQSSRRRRQVRDAREHACDRRRHSRLTLSVSSSTTGSPMATTSPAFFIQRHALLDNRLTDFGNNDLCWHRSTRPSTGPAAH